MFRISSHSKQRMRYLTALVLVSIISSSYAGMAPASAQTALWGYKWYNGKCYKSNAPSGIAINEMSHGNLRFWHVTALSFAECLSAGPNSVRTR